MIIEVLKQHWKQNLFIIMLYGVRAYAIIRSTVLLTDIMNALFFAEYDRFLNAFIYCVLWMGISIILNFIAAVYIEGVKQSQINQLRSNILTQLAHYKYSRFNQRPVGDYVSWLSNDMAVVETQCFDRLYGMISSGALLIFGAIAIWSYHWLLMLVTLIFALIMTVIPKFFKKGLADANKEVSNQNEYTTAKASEWLGGFNTLYVLNSQNLIEKFLMPFFGLLKNSKVHLEKKRATMDAWVQVAAVVFQYAIIFGCGLLIIGGALTAGSIFSIGDLTGNFFGNTNYVINQLAGFNAVLKLFDKVEEVEEVSEENGITITPLKAIDLELQNLSYQFGDRQLTYPDMSFKAGGKYALIGPSGSGKSTLFKILLRQLPDYQGSIRLNGQELKQIPERELYQYLAYVPQKTYLFNLDIRANILLERDYQAEYYQELVQVMQLDELIKVMEAKEETVGQEGSRISGGQGQRVGLARGLVQKAPILLVDEGTSSLDPTLRESIECYLLNLDHATVIFITHHLTDVYANQLNQVYHL